MPASISRCRRAYLAAAVQHNVRNILLRVNPRGRSQVYSSSLSQPAIEEMDIALPSAALGEESQFRRREYGADAHSWLNLRASFSWRGAQRRRIDSYAGATVEGKFGLATSIRCAATPP